MGNFPVIKFDKIISGILAQYNIQPKGELTEDELQRLKLAFESAKDMEAFLTEAKKIIGLTN